MSIVNGYLTVAGLGVDIIYKDIKNLHISVYPPLGRVRVAVPSHVKEDVVRLAIVQRLPWIKSRREELKNAERQSKREMITGETHYVWGQRYQLDVSRKSSKHTVNLKGKSLLVVTPEGVGPEARLATLDRWYRRQLKIEYPKLLSKWEPELGVSIQKVVVRRMKTKWGTCIPNSYTIWLNPELAKKNPRCLEYIIVHELMHLLEKNHSDRFSKLMDRHLPDWRSRRDELNESPLSSEIWK